MIKRLRYKFISINLLIVTVMLLVIFSMVLHFTRENLKNQSIQMLQQAAERERFQLGRPGEGPEEIQMPCFVVRINQWGLITASSNGYYDLSDEALLSQIVQQARAARVQVGVLEEYNLRFSKSSSLFGETIAFADMSGEQATMKDLVKSCAVIGLLSLAAFWGIIIALSRWAVRPVEAAWNQQKQFVADASHELKTPLTVIMTNAELLQQPQYAEEDRARFISSILTMSHQMRGLVEGLLELARVDNSASKMVFAETNLSELVMESLLPFEPVYFEKDLLLESALEEGIRVRGSRSHLNQVMDILLDNAAKYSAPGGAVTVSLRRQGSHCLIRVSNPGEEISKEDLQNIFKRFYRVDKARSMNQSYGLGLSIADSIVKEHGGKIWAESAGGINTFFVQLTTI